MKSKSIFTVAPILPLHADLKEFSKCLDFLKPEYEVTFFDPLNLMHEPNFRLAWLNKLTSTLDEFDAFIGFSYGGALLQSCLDQFESKRKPLLLFAPPVVMDDSLRTKLGLVLDTLHHEGPHEALDRLYSYVEQDFEYDWDKVTGENKEQIIERLDFGFNEVLNSRVHEDQKDCDHYYHLFVGEQSQLVTQKNLMMTKNSQLHLVPNAGMRMLAENPDYCQPLIKSCLHETPNA